MRAKVVGTDALFWEFEHDPNAPVSVILKLRGDTCNIDCVYCYEKRKDRPGGARIVAGDVEVLPQMLPGRQIHVELHGGEPLTLRKGEMRLVLRALAGVPQVTRVTIQTNALLLDDEWIDLFEEEWPGVEFGVSLDGDREGNAWRIDYRRGETYDGVVRGVHLLGKRNVPFGIICVVNSRNVNRPLETIRALECFPGLRGVSFVPSFDMSLPNSSAGGRSASGQARAAASSAERPDWAIAPEQFARFVVTAAAHWAKSGGYRRYGLSPVLEVIQKLRGMVTRSCHFESRKCNHVFTIYPKGRVGACDELPWPQAQVIPAGGAHEAANLAAGVRQSRLLSITARSIMTKCERCSYNSVCGGGCIAARHRVGQVLGSDDPYCLYRTRLIDGVSSLMISPGSIDTALCTKVRWASHEGGDHDGDAEFTPSVLPPHVDLITRFVDKKTAHTPRHVTGGGRGAALRIVYSAPIKSRDSALLLRVLTGVAHALSVDQHLRAHVELSGFAGVQRACVLVVEAQVVEDAVIEEALRKLNQTESLGQRAHVCPGNTEAIREAWL